MPSESIVFAVYLKGSNKHTRAWQKVGLLACLSHAKQQVLCHLLQHLPKAPGLLNPSSLTQSVFHVSC
jgi:hypothetical protein